MPCDRLTRRALVVSTTVVLLAVSTGCLRSSFLRPAAEPIPEPSSPISPGPVVRPSRPPAQVSPAHRYRLQLLSLRPRPVPRLSFLRHCRSLHRTRIRAHLARSSPRHQPSRPYRKPRPRHCRRSRHRRAAPTPTPLLDAALERAEAINHLEDDSPDSSATLAKPADKIPTVVQSRSSPVVSRPSTNPAPIPIVITVDTTEKPKSPGPATKYDALETRPTGPIPPVAKKIEAPADRPPPAAQVPAAIPAPKN